MNKAGSKGEKKKRDSTDVAKVPNEKVSGMLPAIIALIPKPNAKAFEVTDPNELRRIIRKEEAQTGERFAAVLMAIHLRLHDDETIQTLTDLARYGWTAEYFRVELQIVGAYALSQLLVLRSDCSAPTALMAKARMAIGELANQPAGNGEMREKCRAICSWSNTFFRARPSRRIEMISRFAPQQPGPQA